MAKYLIGYSDNLTGFCEPLSHLIDVMPVLKMSRVITDRQALLNTNRCCRGPETGL